MKEVVDAGDYFYLKRSGNFDLMSACWMNLEERQRREVATTRGLFYDDFCGDHNKELWLIPNLKKYLNLGYANLDDLTKFRAAYFATLVADSLFVEPPHFVQPTPENITLIDDHDGFVLKPKNLVKNYQENCTDP